MVIKTGLSNFQSSISRGFSYNGPSSNQKPQQIGKVFGVVLDENTPSREFFEKAGGYSGLGAIYYLDYETSKTLLVEDVNLNDCNIAIPFDPNTKNYPLLGETVMLVDGPSFDSQFSSASGRKFYTGRINVWNNPQQNAPISTTLGKTFVERNDVRDLKSYEGDYIIQNKKSGIRFGSTVKLRDNEWSSIGEDGDPITILVNGYVTTDTGSLAPNIEEVNKEMSSIYMTSTQKIPLIPGVSIINPVSTFLPPSDYVNSQLLFNSDRITLNSRRDEILLLSKTNISLNTDRSILLNAGRYIHFHIDPKNKESRILLGTQADGSPPEEPVLLGGQTHDVLLELCNALTTLAGYLASSTVTTSDGPIAITSVNSGGAQLLSDLENIIDSLKNIQSDKVFTI